MIRRMIVVTALIYASIMVKAQPVFDSAFYANRYNKLFPAFSYNNSTNRQLTAPEKIAGLGKVWSEAKFGFANFDLVPNLNWDSAYMAFIPKVEATKTTTDYYNVLKQFNQLLRDGHSRIMEPLNFFEKTIFSAPLQVRCIEGKAIITALMDNIQPSITIKPGDEIVAIDDVPVQDYIKNKIAPFINFSTPQDSIARIYSRELLSGAANSKIKLTIKDGRGILNDQLLDRTIDLRETSPVTFTWMADSIAYVSINSFGSSKIPEQFDSLFAILSASRGLIIDIRNNRGGNSDNGYEILGRLTDTAFATNQTIFRKYNPAQRSWGNAAFEMERNQFWWKPYKNGTYKKPVVLLTSSFTYSAAEDFTAAFKCMKRGVIIGQKTGGSTGNPLGYSLPGGGVGFVCSKRDLMPDGTEFVGIGISPDIEVMEKISDIKQGIDVALVKGIELIENKNKYGFYETATY
ncbi:peptidase S41-like protein [Thermoflavifilum aggregans]|uniref:Peptidase S41-like protein n=1 Tax=Thermoflavifilum aggregans TaxID=454188 RepID=A0A2M9CX46_9BACT|nr:S41 family peptidase [Thermoflavifilum aggregans]PJJ76465.1 peptidase S41-like protein [Thermoflavifilum aggregans]